jgi:hypothetical protein
MNCRTRSLRARGAAFILHVVAIVDLLVGIDVAASGAEQSLFDWGGLAL